MGGSSGTETATQTSEPWSQAQPYLRDIFSNAQSLYRNGSEYYPGSTVVPFHGDTVAGLQGLRDQFQGDPIGLNEASGTLTNIAGGQGGANPFMSQIQVAGNRSNDAGAGVLNDFASSNQSNPFLDGMFDRAAGKTRDNINAMFSKAGRYGSTAHQGQMGESIGDLAASMYGGAYESDANRRFGAAEALGSRQAGDISRQLGAAATGASLAQSGDAQAMQAAGMLPGLNSYAGANNRGLMGVGSAYENMAGQQLQDSIDRWNFGQNGGWDLLNRYNATVQPIAGMGGQMTQTGPSGQSRTGGAIQGGLGGAATGFSIGGPWGAVVGGGIGALGSMI